jgi:glycogen debranching enzyme
LRWRNIRVFGDADLAQARLAAIRDHLFDAGLGTVSEVFDAAPPYLPGGTPSQAWSVACVIEAWWRIERMRRGWSGPVEAKGIGGRPAPS